MKLPEKSLLRRMILGQVLVVLAFCALAIGNLLWQFYRPVGGEGDASLRLQSAVLSASLVPTTDAGAVPGGLTPGHFAVLEAVALSLEALDDPHGSPSKPGLNRRVWVLDANGATLYQTPGADALAMPNQRAGFFDLAATDGSGPWRAYAHTSSHGVTVQIARRAVPNDNVSQIIGVYVLLPLLGFLPLMGVAAWLSSRQMLRPLGQFARLIAQRSPNDLAPVQQVSDYAEIRPLVGEINGLLAKLAHTLSRERAFLADAAHELRTPLAVIQTQAHVLRHATDEAGKNLAAKELQAGMERAASLIGQLLLTARLDDGSFQPNLAPLELVALLQDRVAVFSGLASKKGIELSLDAPDAAWVRADASTLTSALDNLLDNAIRYTPQANPLARPGDVAPSIAVSVLIEPAGCALVRVVDTGMGIPEALQQRIFERFYRVPGSDQQGSGLGLAIVKRVMDLHGGQVRTVPRPEASGTVFELLLPMPAAARTLVPAA